MTRLEQLRVDRGLTPEQLSEITGISRATISRIESGRGAYPATLVKLAEALSTEKEPVRAGDLRLPAYDRTVAA